MDGIKISQGLGLQDFDLIRVIGRGSYAKVLLVRLKKNDQMYAMKVVKKELVHDDEVRAGAGSRLLRGDLRAPGLCPVKGSKTLVTKFTAAATSKYTFVYTRCLVPAVSFRAVGTPRRKPRARRPLRPPPRTTHRPPVSGPCV